MAFGEFECQLTEPWRQEQNGNQNYAQLGCKLIQTKTKME